MHIAFALLFALRPTDVSMPDPRFRGSPPGAQFFESADRSLSMRISHDMPNRKVRVSSRFFYDVSARGAYIQDALEPTKFWPTCTAEFSNGKALVAGKETLSGNAVIELWSFDPTAHSAARDAKFTPGKVTDKTDLYDSTAPGRDVVMRMHTLRTAGVEPGHVLVQFHASHDLYRLDVATKAMVRVASPEPHPDCWVIPLLARPLISQSREHVKEGHLHILSEARAPEDQPSILVLRDTNRDAILDGWTVMSLAEYQTAGYLTNSAWVD